MAIRPSHILCSLAATVILHLEFHLLSVKKGTKAWGVNGSLVYEDIWTTVLGLNESKPLLDIKPFDTAALNIPTSAAPRPCHLQERCWADSAGCTRRKTSKCREPHTRSLSTTSLAYAVQPLAPWPRVPKEAIPAHSCNAYQQRIGALLGRPARI